MQRWMLLGSLVLSSATLLPIGYYQSGSSSVTTATVDTPTLMRDLETMRRILSKEIRSSSSGSSTDAFTTLAGSFSSVRSSAGDAYYIPGDGALFMIRSSFVLVGSAAKPEKAEVKDPTLWDETKAEVEGRPLERKKSDSRTFDPKKLDELKDRVLHALGRFAPNIAQLTDDAKLTVIVTGVSDSDVRRAGSFSSDNDIAYVLTSGHGRGASEATMVIRIRKGDTKEYSANKIGLPELRQRAEFVTYESAGSSAGSDFIRPSSSGAR